MSLLQNWFDLVESRGQSITQAVAKYNSAHGTFYSRNRFYEWKNGLTVPRDVTVNLQREVLPVTIHRVLGRRLTDEQVSEILGDITPTQKAPEA